MDEAGNAWYATMGFWSLIVALAALGTSMWAVAANKRIARHAKVLDLHIAWQGVNNIDPEQVIGPDVKKAVDALEITAALWKNKIVDRSVLYQSYSRDYYHLYDTISAIDDPIPGYTKTGPECLSMLVGEVYKDMERW